MTTTHDSLKRREFLFLLGSSALSRLYRQPSKRAVEPRSKTALVYSDIYSQHDTGEFHVESPGRLSALYEGLQKNLLLPSLQMIPPKKASMDWILQVHEKSYVDIVRRDVESGSRHLSTRSGNTVICKSSLDVALWAAGGLLAACDAVMSGKAQNAFCAVRPPGHHASGSRGMGFCLFNNAAIAARYLQKKYSLDKVLIVDWDVHHGNGTQEVFYEDNHVFFFSTHQWPWYPWTGSFEETGRGKGAGATLNVPLPAGSGDGELEVAFRNKLAPAMKKFKPDFIIVSAGFDSWNGDPLGRFRVTEEGYRTLTRILLQIAAEHAGGRLVSALEGGYSLKGLSKAVPAHIETLTKGLF